ncbi:MAG: purine-nucleoside phosphorylase [Christensenellales bacterium]|nr:purine-nucleoside phosphorylase [Christensenellales bacterium]
MGLTPHNQGEKGDFAPTVLMPGDPLRAKYIAETYLDNVKLVNNLRNVQGYTGTYNGKPVSVMGSGMGMPSIGIYSYELYNFYGVENIIRVGSAGSIQQNLKPYDVIAAMSAYTDSNYGKQFGFEGMMAPCCDFNLLNKAMDASKGLGINLTLGPIMSSDVFYDVNTTPTYKTLAPLGVMALDMETFALYLNAAYAGKNALTLLTVTDNLLTCESLPPEERQNSLNSMIKIALETAIC